MNMPRQKTIEESRKSAIYADVLAAMQQAEEMGFDGGDYAGLMEEIAREATDRRNTFLDNQRKISPPATMKIGALVLDVRSFSEASTVYQMHRDAAENAGKGGASRFPTGKLFDKAANDVGHVSYNGRVWNLSGDLIEEATVSA